MERTLVISDIHGELEKFERLLKKVKYAPDIDQLILVGDYIDRGPNSKGVLKKVIELKSEGAIVLRGNHEDMMIAAINNEKWAWDRWVQNGGKETLESYGIDVENEELPTNRVFEDHLSFIKELDYYYETDDYIFVHGGVDPDLPVCDTPPSVLVWIRDEFHRNYNGEKTVVFGHTPTKNLHEEKSHRIYFGDNNIIGIDGGAVYGGQLNCLEINSGEMYYVT